MPKTAIFPPGSGPTLAPYSPGTSADGTTLAPDWMRAAAAAVAATVPAATYRMVPGEDHAILRRPEVLAAEISRG